MKKISEIIRENLGNVYQKGTPFSNGHRSRTGGDGFLFDRHNMIDVDELILDASGEIWAVLENKKQTPSATSKLLNILTTKTNQKLALIDLCSRLNCHFFVQIELENKYHLMQGESVKKTFTKEKFNSTIIERNFTRVKTDNLIFLEFRSDGNNIKFVAVVTRIAFANDEVKKFGKRISSTLNVPNVEVDDSGEFIKFNLNGTFIGKVKSVLNPFSVDSELRQKLEKGWCWIYKQMNIFN